MNSPRAVVVLVFAIVIGVLLYLLAPILTPFLLAALFAYIANPLVLRLTRRRIPRGVAVALVFLLLIVAVAGLLFFIVPLLQRQVTAFAQKLPDHLDWMQDTLIPRIESLIGQPMPVDFDDVRDMAVLHWQEIANFLKLALSKFTTSGLHVVLWFVNLALVPIVTFYLLLDWERLQVLALELFPPSARPTIAHLARETDEVLGSFLRGQLLVMLGLAAMYSVGLLFIGLDLALPIGIVAGLVSFVPYLGFTVGIFSAGIAAYIEFQQPMVLLWVFLVFFIAHLVEGYVLTPRFVGSRIGLHPVAVIFSVMAFGQLFGFLGVLLALPAAAALKVWLGYLHRSYIAPPPKAPRARRTRAGNDAETR
ncbi:MAG: AI-2E family transporter [Gammaproteobacteria bacterium]|nr:AI-2E family transporter [Gammaproteobacteria bacterium]